MEYLLSQGVELDIYAACVLGQTEAVRSFLDADPALLNAKAGHAHRKTPLFCRGATGSVGDATEPGRQVRTTR